MTPNWAELAAMKAEMKQMVLSAYDESVRAGFDRGEILAMLSEMIPEEQRVFRGLYRHWIDTERPE